VLFHRFSFDFASVCHPQHTQSDVTNKLYGSASVCVFVRVYNYIYIHYNMCLYNNNNVQMACCCRYYWNLFIFHRLLVPIYIFFYTRRHNIYLLFPGRFTQSNCTFLSYRTHTYTHTILLLMSVHYYIITGAFIVCMQYNGQCRRFRRPSRSAL